MRAHYVKFDVGNKRLGFAQIKKSATVAEADGLPANDLNGPML